MNGSDELYSDHELYQCYSKERVLFGSSIIYEYVIDSVCRMVGDGSDVVHHLFKYSQYLGGRYSNPSVDSDV